MKHELLFTAGLLDALEGRGWPSFEALLRTQSKAVGSLVATRTTLRDMTLPLGPKFNGRNLKRFSSHLVSVAPPLPPPDCFSAVMVASQLQRQPALQRCWRPSCHGPWKPSRKTGARLIQTLQFIDNDAVTRSAGLWRLRARRQCNGRQ